MKILGILLLFAYSVRTFFAQAINIREYGDTILILDETRKWVSQGIKWQEFGAYSPFAQLFIMPFTFLSNPKACSILYAMNWVALLGTIFLFYSSLIPQIQKRWLLFATILLLNFWPLAYAMRAAKIEPVELFLIMLSLRAYQWEKKTLSAATLAAATLLKFLPGVLVLYFLVKKDWKWLARYSIFVGLITLVTCGWLGVDYHIDYFRSLSGGYIPWIFNQAPEAALQRLLYTSFPPVSNVYYPNPEVGFLFRPVLIALKIGLLCWVLRVLYKRECDIFVDCGLLLLCVPFLMKFYREYYIVLALPFFFAVIRDFLQKRSGVHQNRAGIFLLGLGFFLITFLGIFEVWFTRWTPQFFPAIENYHAIPYLSLPFWGFVFLVISWFRIYGRKTPEF